MFAGDVETRAVVASSAVDSKIAFMVCVASRSSSSCVILQLLGVSKAYARDHSAWICVWCSHFAVDPLSTFTLVPPFSASQMRSDAIADAEQSVQRVDAGPAQRSVPMYLGAGLRP
eukprot:2291615-Amphidinium_carterae.4